MPPKTKRKKQTEKDLQEFEETENRLITKVLHWHKDGANSIRALLLDGQGKMDARKHTKLKSLLDEKDFKEDCQSWLYQQKPELCFSKNLKVYIEETLFPKLTGHIKRNIISEKTC
ncbi:4667_t:CDS:2 [Diversispora eburnea]|uniref:4667_t:CDS:1 n=1 Tax=Diversispora eburnea TaxID=1213867 RepID=A0A9N9AH51_9GLOM|nr:4667_t:CDS:2 [Diversispora eburnea]